MILEDKKMMQAVKFYLNKLITENDSIFIINALDSSNFDIKQDNGIYNIKVNYKKEKDTKEESIKIISTFSKDRIELHIDEKIKGMFNDNEIIDSSYTKERYALYEVTGKDIVLNYKQSYNYSLTTKDNKTSSFTPVEVDEKVDLEFIQGENNLLTNYQNIRYKNRNKVLKK